MPVHYKIKKQGLRGETVDNYVSTSQFKKKYPPEILIKRNLRAIRVESPSPKKIRKQPKKPMKSMDYYRKLSEKAKQKQKRFFERRRK